MTEPTPSPAPTPAPTPAVKTRKRGIGNLKQQKSLTLAEAVCTAAAQPEYAGILDTGHEITPDFIAELADDCATARGDLGQIVEKAVAKGMATGTKTGTKKALIRAIRAIQAAARQKYSGSQPLMLKEYYIGEKIDATDQSLEQVGTAISDLISPPAGSSTAADVLPGVNAAKISALANAVTAYTAAWSAQTAAKSDKEKGHLTVSSLIDSIDDRRRQVQFAADGEWPFDVAANAPIRREFGLPVNRPFTIVVNGVPTEAPEPDAVKEKVVRKKTKVQKTKVKKAVKTVKASQPAKKKRKK